MSYSDNIIGAPVSIKDVQKALNVDDVNDLGKLCTHEYINMWSKYKPVNNTLKFVKDTVNSDGNTWAEATEGKGWWLGEIDRAGRDGRAIYFPTITSMASCDTTATAPQYVKPAGGETSPYRLTDFVGYYDDAVAPMRVNISTQNEIGKEWSCNIEVVDPDDYEDFDSAYDPKHCYSWNDILDILQAEKVYPAVLVYNKTKKMKYFYVGHSAIGAGDNVVKFKLGDGSPYSEGGMGFVSNSGDVLEMYVCATEYDDSEVYDDFRNAYRLSNMTNHVTLTLTSDKKLVNKTFTAHGSGFDYTIEALGETRYIPTTDDDVVSGTNVLKLNAGGIIWKATENDMSAVSLTSVDIYVWINIIGEDSNGGTVNTSYLSNKITFSPNPTSDKVYSLEDFTSLYYPSQADAEARDNACSPGGSLGILIPDTIVYGSTLYEGKVKKVEVRAGANFVFSSDKYRVMQSMEDDLIYSITY